MKYPIICPNFDLGDGLLLCGQHEAAIKTYRKFKGKNGNVWLVAMQENAGNNIYLHQPNDTNSQGFGGATIPFQLQDGTIYEAKGPWHSNADSLYEETGYDVRDTIPTQVAIGLRRGNGYIAVGDVFYLEEKPVMGRYNRYKAVAQKFADELKTIVFIAMKSYGGGTGDWIAPSNWTQEQQRAYWKQYELSK